MGEYYSWVNIDKHEYLCPYDFGYGNKRHESIHRNNVLLRAVYELLSDSWSGDRIIFLGDEFEIPQSSEDAALQELYKQTAAHGCPGYPFDMVVETYRNVSGLFKASEKVVREEISYYLSDLSRDGKDSVRNEYGIDVEHPFRGLFLKCGKGFQYVIDHTKKICYSFTQTRILYIDDTECEYADPLPILMTCGRNLEIGSWVGDVIGVADRIDNEIKVLDSLYLDW